MYEELIDLTSNFLVIFRNIAKKHAITSSQGLIMLMIDIQGISMTLLSCKLGLDASTMTRNIEKLEKIWFHADLQFDPLDEQLLAFNKKIEEFTKFMSDLEVTEDTAESLQKLMIMQMLRMS